MRCDFVCWNWQPKQNERTLYARFVRITRKNRLNSNKTNKFKIRKKKKRPEQSESKARASRRTRNEKEQEIERSLQNTVYIFIWPLESRTIQTARNVFTHLRHREETNRREKMRQNVAVWMNIQWEFTLWLVFFLLSHSRIAIFLFYWFSLFALRFATIPLWMCLCVRTAFVFFKFKLNFGRGSSCEPFRHFFLSLSLSVKIKQWKYTRKKKHVCIKNPQSEIATKGLRKHFFAFFSLAVFSMGGNLLFLMYSGAKS